MRIHIFGAGASGGHLAVRLALAGHEVSVVARGEQLAAIRRNGLRLQVGEMQWQVLVAASSTAADFGPQDVVIVAVKSTALAVAAQQIGPLIGPQTLVVFAQNGMTWWYPTALPPEHPPMPRLPIFGLADAFLALMDPEQVVPGIVLSANEVVAPGQVRNNSPQRNAFEIAALMPQAEAHVQTLREALIHAGIESPPIEDARAAVWLKLVGNASASPLAMITGNPTAIAHDPALREVFLRIVDECLSVAAACGYDVAQRIDLSRWGRQREAHKPSLLQDYELGRPLELAEMVLAPAAIGRSLGVPTPSLDVVAAIASHLGAARGLFVTRS